MNPDTTVDGVPASPGPDTTAGEPSVPKPEGESAMTLSELNEYLGKNFRTKETALKALKDTFSFVGRRVEDIKNEVKAELGKDDRFDKLSEQLSLERKERFFLVNPQFVPHRKLIESLGSDPEKVVQTDTFKDVFNRLEEHGRTSKLRTVLESNPRLASSRDNLTKARDLKKAAGKVTEEVESLVTGAVIDAYGLNEPS